MQPKLKQLQPRRGPQQLAKDLDPSRPTVGASNLRVTHPLNWITDLTSFNRYFGWYTRQPERLAGGAR